MDNIEVIKAEVAPVVSANEVRVINSDEELIQVAAYAVKVDTAVKKVEDFWDPIVKKAFDTHKAAINGRKEMREPLVEKRKYAYQIMLEYKHRRERVIMEEQRKAQAIADEAARKERERLEKEAAKLKTPELREQRLEQAAAIIPPVIAVSADVPKFDGLTTAKTWKAEVVDVSVLPREWMVPNETALNSFAKATKGAVPVAGVRFVKVESFRNK